MIRRLASLARLALLFAAVLPSTSAIPAHAQADVPPSETSKILSHVDLAIQGSGQLTKDVSGTVQPVSATAGQEVSQSASSTVGVLVSIRYVAKPYVGGEFNYNYGRYTENYSFSASSLGGLNPFPIQTTANEYSFGYVATPPHPIFGFQPFVSVGAGVNEFKPTADGGEGAPRQARALYYYSAGLQQGFGSGRFGVRASFRQAFFLAPDFGQNYLTIKQHTNTIEPTVGFYVRF